MSVEDASVIDVIGSDPQTGRVVLTISDHLSWEDLDEHAQILRRKVQSYLGFISGGQLDQVRPGATARGVEIGLVFEHEPPSEAEPMLSAITRELAGLGIVLSYGTLPPGY